MWETWVRSLGWEDSLEKEMATHSSVLAWKTPWTVACTKLLHPRDFPDKSIGVSCHFLLQGIFLTQGSNPGLLHCRQMLYRLGHQGSSWGSPECLEDRQKTKTSDNSHGSKPSWKQIFQPQPNLQMTAALGDGFTETHERLDTRTTQLSDSQTAHLQKLCKIINVLNC